MLSEQLLDRLLARFEDAPRFKAWYAGLDEEVQDDLLFDLQALIGGYVK